jgi:WD40 repeat protein
MKAKRNRGVLLTLQGWQKFQEAIDQLEQQENLGEKFTVWELGKRTGLDGSTIAKVLDCKECVDLHTLERFLSAFNLELDEDDYTKPNSKAKNVERKKEIGNYEKAVWSEMPTVPIFHGRTEELTCLEQWLMRDRCQLVALLGMGGIGKTALSVKLVERVEDQFDAFIWCSLRNAPPLKEVLCTALQYLSNHQQVELDIPQNMSEGIYRLINYFKERRCLVVLDNAEALLRSGDKAGNYREGYEEYGELFRQVGEQRHQSCLILTSREKPNEIGLLEGPILPVRSFQLSGLSAIEGREIFAIKGTFTGSEEEWSVLIQHYAGNPLALRMVAAAIQELFDGSITEILEYLKQGVFIFDDIRGLLDQQFERLSDLEREIMYWLAIEREPISLQQLKDNILSGVSRQQLPEGLRSLRQRSLIDMSAASFTQQPVVMEYMTDRIVENTHKEIVTEKVELLMKYALIKAQAKDYVRESQIRLILEPIAERIETVLNTKEAAKEGIDQILLNLKREFSAAPGYGAGNILNLLSQLKIDLTDYDFSHLTVWQAYLRDVNLHYVNFAHADLEKSVFIESFGGIFSTAFSPDGELLAIGDANGEVRLWQGKNAKQILILNAHESWVWSVRFSPDGQTLATCSQDRTAKLWDIRTGQCLRTLQGGDYIIRSVQFSPDGQTLASGHGDATARLWDVHTGECLQTFQGHDRGVWSVSFHPVRGASPEETGRILASGSGDRTVKLWDIATGVCLKTLSGHTSWIWSVSFSPDGKTLASGSDDRTIKLWDTDTGQCLKTLQGHHSSLRSVEFSPDGQTLASGSDDRTARLWNAHTGKCLKTLRGHEQEVWCVSFSPDSQTLASNTGGNNPVVKLWDVHTGQCLKVLQGYAVFIWSVDFSPDGQTLASGSNGPVQLWNADTGQCLKTLQGHEQSVRCVNFSPNGKILASSSDDQTIRLWDVDTGLCLRTLHSPDAQVFCVCFSPDGQTLASSHSDTTVKLWDVQTGQCLKTLKGHTSWVWSVCFSPNGQTLVSGSLDYTVRVWDVQTGQCLRTLKGHTSWVWSVRFSPVRGASPEETGKTIASSSDDRTIRLWDAQDGTCLKVLEGHTKGVWDTSFSPDGHTLATCSEDRTIKVWSMDTGTCIKTLENHSSGLLSVAFSPKGHLIASGSQDHIIKLWDVATDESLRTLKADKPYEGMNITGIRGLSEAQKASLRELGALSSPPGPPTTLRDADAMGGETTP